jgi:hypothetical protein
MVFSKRAEVIKTPRKPKIDTKALSHEGTKKTWFFSKRAELIKTQNLAKPKKKFFVSWCLRGLVFG